MNKYILPIILTTLIVCLGAFGAILLRSQKQDTTQPEPTTESSTSKTVQKEESISVYDETESFTIEVDGADRQFIVYRPESLEASEEVPIVFMLHGASGTGQKFYNISGWKELAAEEGFMVVFPTALKYRTYSEEKVMRGKVVEDVYQNITRWNGYGLEQSLDPRLEQTLYDDVEFFREMIDFIEERYAVDSSQRYATGFSSGGSMVTRLSIEATDLFAAFATMGSGSIPPEALGLADEALLDSATPRPRVAVIGQTDAKILYNADLEVFPMDESLLDNEDVQTAVIDSVLTFNGLEDEYKHEQTPNASIFRYDSPVSPPEYRFIILGEAGHIYPNGKNHPVTIANVFWNFFQEYRL